MNVLQHEDLDLEYIEARRAGLDDLQKVHDARYLEMLERVSQEGGGALTRDTRVSSGSFEVARRAAGAVLSATNAVVSGGGRAFCLVRPPGHHALPDRAMGFCLINSVAVGARAAQSAGAKRVAIVDFDVHHGNGTQEIFYDDAAVLYLSLHQYPWYPGPSGALELTGSADGASTNVNLPLQGYGSDDVYVASMHRLVIPIVEEFEPDLLMVSAGFDAHSDDPLSLMEVTASGFAVMSDELCGLADRACGGRVVFVLEGGYKLEAMAESVRNSISVVSGAPAPGIPPIESFSPRSVREVDSLVEFHSRRWKVT